MMHFDEGGLHDSRSTGDTLRMKSERKHKLFVVRKIEIERSSLSLMKSDRK